MGLVLLSVETMAALDEDVTACRLVVSRLFLAQMALLVTTDYSVLVTEAAAEAAAASAFPRVHKLRPTVSLRHRLVDDTIAAAPAVARHRGS